MTLQIVRGSVGAGLLAAVLSLPVIPALAAPIVTQVGIVAQYDANGPAYTIGTLSATIDYETCYNNGVSSQLTLAPDFRNVISDATGGEIRVLQVIDSDTDPILTHAGTYIGATTLPSGKIVQTQPVIDVPTNGWQYEDFPRGRPGDDTIPFYETDGERNAAGQLWAYPTLSYADLHSPDSSAVGYMRTEDDPNEIDPNQQTLFTTLYTYEDPALLASQTIDVLGGYNWGIESDGYVNLSATPVTDLPFAAITSADVSAWQGALNVSGFSGWTVQANDVILTDVPEPPAWSLLLAPLFALGLARRKPLSKVLPSVPRYTLSVRNT